MLAIGVMVFAGGVGDWRALSNINDPLPQAMKTVVGNGSGWLHMLVWLGLFGLVASFHGIIMGYSRQIYSLARAGYLPAGLASSTAARAPRIWQSSPGAWWDRRDLLRLADHHQRHAADRLHRHHVGIWGYCYVYHFHGGAVQTAP